MTDLGVTKVLNFRDDPKWGETAQNLTPDGEGIDLVIDVGGAGSLGRVPRLSGKAGRVKIPSDHR